MANLKESERELKEAERKYKFAQAKDLARRAEESLKQASRDFWKLARHCDTECGDDSMWETYKKINHTRSLIAAHFLGAEKRALALNALDGGRWSFEDKKDPLSFSYGLYTLNTEKDLYHALATWIFDTTGVRGYNADSLPAWLTMKEREKFPAKLESLKADIIEAFSTQYPKEKAEEIAEKALETYKKGDHDT